MKTFSNEKALPQHSVLGYKIDLYFLKHKLAIAVQKIRVFRMAGDFFVQA